MGAYERDLPNGWCFNQKVGAWEFRWDGKLIHQITEEAWADYGRYSRTIDGRAAMKQILLDNLDA